jgi:coproporphyrinogen III oxidase
MGAGEQVEVAKSASAAAAYALVQSLQRRLADALARVASDGRFAPVTWLRDGGRHGGGSRFAYADGATYLSASVNVSQVHYDDEPARKLGSASALSAIVHPAAPWAPSVHMHISWTEMKDGSGYWRLMADLNPCRPDVEGEARFRAAFERAAPGHVELGTRLGDQYFHIPALGRTRGVAHFYLEQFNSGDTAADLALAKRFGETMIDAYAALLRDRLGTSKAASPEETAQQLAYHTLYFFQVLTLDRGTTSGLLVHDQNDVGILASLPPLVDTQLLTSWASRLDPPQDGLVRALVAALPPSGRVGDAEKVKLCGVVRAHYAAHPEALTLQAKADVAPPTVANHGPGGR